MTCPRCGTDSDRVVDTYASTPSQFRRRRECQQCGHRFSTREDVVSGDTLKSSDSILGYADGHAAPFKSNRKNVHDARGVLVASAISPEFAQEITAYLNERYVEAKRSRCRVGAG